jgi:hypothetical protein
MLLGAVGVLATGGAAAAGPASAQVQAWGAPVTIDGPSADIQSLSGISVARDGTGGLVYVKNVAGVPHVFVSLLLAGSFRASVEVDSSLPGPSSQPVVAASPGGLLWVAFINAGQLYVVNRTGPTGPFSTPAALFAGASNPAIDSTALGKAYIAFTAAGAGGHDVRVAYYWQGRWSLELTPLDAAPADDAGTGAGAPAVAAAGDGVAIVAWGENGHVDTRRVWGDAPSTVFQQVDVPSVSGWNEVSADQPSVSAGGDSSYVDVAFDETVSNGVLQQQRVLLRRLRAGLYDPVTLPDGLSTPGPEGAIEPRVSMGEYGYGLATAARATSNQVWVATLAAHGLASAVMRLDSLANATAPYAVPVSAGYYSGLVAWQHDPGSPGSAEIRARYYDGTSFGPEVVVSSPAAGATNAADGLVAGSDIAADVAVAWVQGSGASTEIVAAQLYQPPGAFGAAERFRYVRNVTPLLSWTDPREFWGPEYQLTLDAQPATQTTATSFRTGPLTQGPHAWSVKAVNGGGLQSSTSLATVFVDTYPPAVTYQLGGTRQVHKELHIYVRYSDTPPAGTAAQSSGISKVVVRWGDRTTDAITHGKFHAYKHPGHYLITITVTDQAGNKTTVSDPIVIKPKPKPKPKPKHKHGKTTKRGRVR